MSLIINSRILFDRELSVNRSILIIRPRPPPHPPQFARNDNEEGMNIPSVPSVEMPAAPPEASVDALKEAAKTEVSFKL